MLELNIIETYSKVHTQQFYTNNDDVSFDGSQKQSEFFAAWNYIVDFYENKKPTELTFLEVGAWKGLWGLAFLEFCKEKNIKGKYVTITMIDQDPNNQPLYKTLDYMNNNGIVSTLVDCNTLDESALPKVLEHGNEFNIVFIDAGHKYHEAKNDIDKFSSLATDLLIFHDIRPIITNANCGVYEALQDSNTKLDWEITTDNNLMGIGIKNI
jgi:hypothetical protein